MRTTFLSALISVPVASILFAAQVAQASPVLDVIRSYQKNAAQRKLRPDTSVQLMLEQLPAVETTSHTRLVPQFTEKGLRIVFQYDVRALETPELMMPDLLRMRTAVQDFADAQNTDVSQKLYGSTLPAWAEIFLNAQAGSPTAQARLASVDHLLSQSKLLYSIAKDIDRATNSTKASATIPALQEQFAIESSRANALAAEHISRQSKALKKWQQQTKRLDMLEQQNDRLNDLILKNDRRGVREMIEAYLPWPLMEPIETKAWRSWLDAIEKPDFKNATVAFRGVDYETDKVQRLKNVDGTVTMGFMSSLLTKNQGSYTRRLRSLSTSRLSNGTGSFAEANKAIPTVTIADTIFAHANDPKASAFLSFTKDPFTAAEFIGLPKVPDLDFNNLDEAAKTAKVRSGANGGLLAVRIDSRRMFGNFNAVLRSEAELLAPLIIFPDEIVLYQEGDFQHDGGVEENVSDFVKRVNKLAGTNIRSVPYANKQDPGYLAMIKSFDQSGLSMMQGFSRSVKAKKSCQEMF